MKLSDFRYEQIKATVVATYDKYDIRHIPIDCYEICLKMNIKLVEYSKLTDIGLQKAISVSEDGFCMLKDEGNMPFNYEQWYIFYNDSMGKERIKFTILHEIGHIVLGHTQHSELAESEANFFAKYAISPPPLIDKIKPEDFVELADKFELSMECAFNSMRYYNNWLNYGGKCYKDYELKLLEQFEPYFERGDVN